MLSIVIHANELPEYEAKYKFDSKEISITGIREFKQINNEYEMQFKASNLFASMFFLSKFGFTAAPIVLGAPNWIAPGADMEDTYAPQEEDIFDSVFGEFFPDKRVNKRGIRSWDFIQLAGQGL